MRSSAVYAEPRRAERRVEIKEIAGEKQPKRIGVLKAAGCMACVVLMLSALVYARVEQTELMDEYNQYVAMTNSMAGTNAQLQVQIEQMFSPESIARIAREEIGMNEIRSQQIEYVEFDNMVKAEVVEKNPFWVNWWNSIQNWVHGR